VGLESFELSSIMPNIHDDGFRSLPKVHIHKQVIHDYVPRDAVFHQSSFTQ